MFPGPLPARNKTQRGNSPNSQKWNYTGKSSADWSLRIRSSRQREPSYCFGDTIVHSKVGLSNRQKSQDELTSISDHRITLGDEHLKRRAWHGFSVSGLCNTFNSFRQALMWAAARSMICLSWNQKNKFNPRSNLQKAAFLLWEAMFLKFITPGCWTNCATDNYLSMKEYVVEVVVVALLIKMW